ncbi:hypothetical protein [Pedobacter sp. SYP-B3415]|uniref:hypothetical protein n=1 Tax=Pedobacter sp. SYP-B3415 TaxID=2496641 RepID=UPI00101B8C03|nr:hypothetical protein [Pedobacter sp. SYP-B3415]
MDNLIIFTSLLIFAFSSYIVWPSRQNVVSHLSVGGGFIAIFVPIVILNVKQDYPESVVALYVSVLLLGAVCYLPFFILGFAMAKGKTSKFTFDVLPEAVFEKRTVKLTQFLMLAGIAGLAISYAGMGFIPMFAKDPIAAKLFRAQYQAPYLRVAVLFRSSFYILATIMPIACIIWYKFRSGYFLLLVLAALVLMSFSLVRAGSFGGVVFAITIVMSLKSRKHFIILMFGIIGIFIMSSFFYYIIGVRTFTSNDNFWKILAAGSSDIQDQFEFLVKFEDNPVFTYGRTIYGGLIPGHYKWNPSVYTLSIIAPTEDINQVGSGGIRLPLPLWGYVSFKWIGVVLFCVSTGFLNGYFLRILKNWFAKFSSILIKTVCITAFGSIYGTIINFTQLNMFFMPPLVIILLYVYRFKWR